MSKFAAGDVLVYARPSTTSNYTSRLGHECRVRDMYNGEPFVLFADGHGFRTSAERFDLATSPEEP